MDNGIFCCANFAPYRPNVLDHESKFSAFINWAKANGKPTASTASSLVGVPYAVQLVRQINFGPQESIRYFIPTEFSGFQEINERYLIDANFEKLNS
jgi:hypothetical protein